MLRAVEVEAFVRSMRLGLRLGVMMLLAANVAAQSAQPVRGGVSAGPGPWKQLAKLTESNGQESDWLGWSVAISKDGSTVGGGSRWVVPRPRP